MQIGQRWEDPVRLVGRAGFFIEVAKSYGVAPKSIGQSPKKLRSSLPLFLFLTSLVQKPKELVDMRTTVAGTNSA